MNKTIQSIAKDYEKTKAHQTTLLLRLTQELSITYKDHIYYPVIYLENIDLIIESILDNTIKYLTINMTYTKSNIKKAKGLEHIHTKKILTPENIEEVLKELS